MLLKGSEVSAELSQTLLTKIEECKKDGIIPTLGIIRVGEKPEDLSYERSVIKRCGNLGIQVQTFALAETAGTEDMLQIIDYVNKEQSIHGVLMFSPLPKHMNEAAVRSALAPEKDVDGITPHSQYGVFSGTSVGYPPCTADACMRILKHYQIPIAGRHAVVVGRSMVVGKPLSMMLLKENATVTICHSRTENLEEICKEADIVIAAVGKARLLNEKHLTAGQTVLDVGIHSDGEGSLCGDVDFAAVSEQVAAITPVPGGVGTVTTTVLLCHVVEAAEKQRS